MKSKVRVLSLVLAVLFIAASFASCAKAEFDYDKSKLSKYVAVGEYKGIAVDVTDATLTEDDVQTALANLLEQNATTNQITDRTVVKGDTINLDYTGYVDGVAFDNGSATGVSLTVGSSGYIDGFDDALVGGKVGEEFEIKVTFPDPYTNNPDLAGKAATFKIKVNYIEETVVPELDADFVKTVSSYTTVEEFMNYYREKLAEQKKTYYDQLKVSDVWTKVVDGCTIFEYPENKTKVYYDEFISYYESQASYYSMDLATMLTQMGSTQTELESKATEYAEGMVKEDLICRYIAQKENLALTDDEFNSTVESLATQQSMSSDAFIEKLGREYIYNSLLFNKVTQYLADNAVVTIVPEATETTAAQ